MDIDAVVQTFFQESQELLSQMEQQLLELEKDSSNTEALGALFRAIHTLKGSAGMFQFESIVKFTHVAENVLDLARDGAVALTEDLVTILLACHDYLEKLIDHTGKSREEPLPEELINQGELLVSQLSAYLVDKEKNQEIQLNHEEQPGEKGFEIWDARETVSNNLPINQEQALSSTTDEERAFAELPVEASNWHISLRFGQEVFKQGLDPLSFIKYLNKLGKISNLVTVPDGIPDAKDMDPENCYLGFEIEFNSVVDKVTIEKVFEFLEDDCRINILPPYSKISQYRELIRELPETPMRIGEILHFSGALSRKELDQALREQVTYEFDPGKDDPGKDPLGKILVNQKAIRPEVLGFALEKQKKMEDPKAISGRSRDLRGIDSHFIRVDAEKLDQLINLIGELVISSASVNDQAEKNGDSAMMESVSIMSRLVSEIRDTTLNVRMVQIGETFNRYRRIVRDLSKEMNKEVELNITGGETELDKTIIEKITDPLTHLIRNAMDHGIDFSEERQKKGKSEKGTIRLNAFHETGAIVIEVIDDGNGLNQDRIYEKAEKLGMIQPKQKISDKDLFQFIFQPGFSTAEEVTDVSGRGVGMDVVKRNIESLRGSVDIDSKMGEGTTVRIRLPLTLAIIDGFLVEVENAKWVVPLDMVVECVDFSRSDQDLIKVDQHEDFINLRGEVLPFLRLNELFSGEDSKDRQKNIVVVQYAGQKTGLLVDSLIGEFQTVIKSLGPVFQNLRGISGATILGSGEVALIIDVPRLVQHAKELEESSRKKIS